jgi:outer membrane protein
MPVPMSRPAIPTIQLGIQASPLSRFRRILKSLLPAAALIVLPYASKAETLRDALRQAFQTNPTLNAQRANVFATNENLPRAQAGYKPKISAAGDVGYYRDSYKLGDGTRTDLNTVPRGMGLQVDQNVFDGFRTGNSIRQAEAQMGGADAILSVTEQSTLLDAAAAYMDVLTDKAILTHIRGNINALKEQLRQTKERHDFGDVTKTDVAQVETRLAGARAQGSLAEANLKASIANYARIIGADPKLLVTPRPVDQLVPPNLDDTIKVALAENPAIHAAMYGVQVSLFQTKIIRGELLPTVSLTGLLAKRHDVTVAGDGLMSGSITGTLKIPLYDGDEIRSRVRQSRYVTDQRKLEADAKREEVRAAVITRWAQLQAAKERVGMAQLQLNSAETALTGLRSEWELGERTMREVLDSQQDLLTARVNLVVAQRDRIVTSYALAQIEGRLNVATLDRLDLNAPKDSIFTPATSAMPLPSKKYSAALNLKTQRCDQCGVFAEGWNLRSGMAP